MPSRATVCIETRPRRTVECLIGRSPVVVHLNASRDPPILTDGHVVSVSSMVLPLVPAPVSVREMDAAPFRLTSEVRTTGEPAAVGVLTELLAARTRTLPRTEPRAQLTDGGTDASPTAPTIDLRITAGGAAESYRLMADEASIVIEGADAAGLFYGVQTLGQLITTDGDGWVIPAVEIHDAPRFTYRGVMLDVARHFFPVEVVIAYIDRAATLKLNHLHLHLSDDQGWRLQLQSRPELTELASNTAVGGDPGGFFTRDDFRAIVAHAASRHMTVVPEIDVPGHTHAVGLAYPELVEAPVITEEIREATQADPPIAGKPYTGVAVGFSSLKIDDEATYAFLADLFGELAGLTPGPYLHIGGDECLGTDPDDFATFVERATELVRGLGKTPITWHEAGAARGLAPGTVGQYWGFVTPTDGMDDAARAFVRNGGQIILSPADAVYLDMKPDIDSPLGLTWANGPTSVARAYDWDPLALIDGILEADILGVEAPMWAETIRTLADIDALAFPRIAAAAEIAWSSAPFDNPLRTWPSFQERVGGLAPLWNALGVGFPGSAEIPWTRG